jgi:hypothetical protein
MLITTGRWTPTPTLTPHGEPGQDSPGTDVHFRPGQGDWVAATLEMLNTLPLAGKVVTMDAGLLHRSVAQTVVKKGVLPRISKRQSRGLETSDR